MRFRESTTPGYMASHNYIPLNEISLDFIRCIIFIEDFDFYSHIGFDIESIQYAFELNKKYGSFVYGGSTITQQLARTLFLNPQKNYLRKYLEFLIAIEIELILSKERILELYLNYIEWGPHIYGIGTAAYYYFAKNIRQLSSIDKIKLIAIMPNPLLYTPYNFTSHPILRRRYNALKRFNEFLKKMMPRFESEIKEQTAF